MTKLDATKPTPSSKAQCAFKALGLTVNLALPRAPREPADRPFADAPIRPSGGHLGTGPMVRECSAPRYPAPAHPDAVAQLSLHPDLNRKLVGKALGPHVAKWVDYYRRGQLAVRQNPKHPSVKRPNPPRARIAKINVKIARADHALDSAELQIRQLRNAATDSDRIQRIQAKIVEQEHSKRALQAQVHELNFARKNLTLKKFERIQAEPFKPIVSLREMKKTHFQ